MNIQQWKVFHVAPIETIVWHFFCLLVIQCCTSIHHLTRYLSTLYRLTRNLSTTQIYHLARDLDVSRKLNCVLLNLKNKTFSCNAMSSTITVFFDKRDNLSQNHIHFLSLDIQNIFLKCKCTLTFFTLCRNQTGLSYLGTTLVRAWTCTEEKGSLNINRKIVVQPTWPLSDLSM